MQNLHSTAVYADPGTARIVVRPQRLDRRVADRVRRGGPAGRTVPGYQRLQGPAIAGRVPVGALTRRGVLRSERRDFRGMLFRHSIQRRLLLGAQLTAQFFRPRHGVARGMRLPLEFRHDVFRD